MADIQGKLQGINQKLGGAVSAARSAGRIARGGSASGKPSSSNSNYDRADNTVGTAKAKNIRYNQAVRQHTEMQKNESALAKNQAAHKTASASQVRNKKFNADFNAMKQNSPIHQALNTRQNWR